MPTYRVYHADNPTFFMPHAQKAVKDFPKGYTMVATVHAADIEDVFMATNNINRPWTQNVNVIPSGPVVERGGCRSTSVGDVITNDNDVPFLVGDVGFVLVQ